MTQGTGSALRIFLATEHDRDWIYRLRHTTYAEELGQHPVNTQRQLSDPLDEFNTYLVASVDGRPGGFVSITPPTHGALSIDKYVTRDRLPFEVDDGVYEVRLLTVEPEHRGTGLTALLMYAAFRHVDALGARRVVVMGRREVLGMYRKVGLEPIGIPIRSGAVDYELLTVTMDEARKATERVERLRRRLEQCEWDLAPAPPQCGEPEDFTPASCFHGGAFFDAVGRDFHDLGRRRDVVNADVLDAWFPPSPGVVSALQEHLPWLASTSPPTGAEGMVRTVADVRGIPQSAVLPGAGSSALIYLALGRLLSGSSRVLLLDPTYGEYAHVLERVIGARVDRIALHRESSYDVSVERLVATVRAGYDLVVVVNPNSPTGRHLDRERLEDALAAFPEETLVWVDETYVDYVGAQHSLEGFAARSPNVVVCKSMSKVYALSGLRAAYLCGPPRLIGDLRPWNPPWAVSLPAQVAAVRALQDPGYYAGRYAETHALREGLAGELRALDVDVIPGTANFLLCQLPPGGPDAASVVKYGRRDNVFLRDAGPMGTGLGSRALRVAVKDPAGNRRIVDAVAGALRRAGRPRAS